MALELTEEQVKAGWTIQKMGDLGEIFDGPHATAKKIESGPYYLSISSLVDGRLVLAESAHISEEDFSKWTKRVTPVYPDLLFSYETKLGSAALMPRGVRASLGRRMGLIRFDTQKVNPHFMLYKWLSPEFQRYIQQHKISGATVERIALSELGKWEVALPSKPDQDRIAEILGSLDDKIEVNNALLNSLDEYLRLDYVASINQDKDLRTVSDIALEVREGVSAQEIDESDVYVGLEHLPRRNVWLSSWGNGSEVTSNKSRFKKGDILFGKLRPYFHKVVVAPVDGVCSTDIIVVRPKPGFERLALQVLSSDAVIEYATNVSNGTRMPRAKWSDLKDFEVRGSAELKSVASFELAATLIAENRQLVETRDLLIRQLIG